MLLYGKITTCKLRYFLCIIRIYNFFLHKMFDNVYLNLKSCITGCKTPGRKDKLFNCGAMTAKQEDLNSALSPCGSGSHVVYAWALNAPELILPEGVGFRVGGPDSDIDWLVLQVHYASIDRIPEEGIFLFFCTRRSRML